ncbi:hypothetical protein BJ912DRAFT_1026853 [Pholiota molesta]|nr:hypothetical protein BJ912DRAFT_1026853 [Pholiota molesta]
MEHFLHQRGEHNAMAKRHVQHERENELVPRDSSTCEPPDPANTVTDRLNALLQNGGDGYVLQLCPNAVYLIQAPILFAHPNQEISTQGYPTTDARAVLAVSGPVQNGQGHTTAVDGTCATCSGVKLRNIQIDGTRQGAPPTNGGGNIEMGGANQNQLVEYVHSYDPRGWTCLHVAEGPLTCDGIVIQNNDIGPCGSDAFQEWADGISVSCRNATVRNNMVEGPTDGGIVLFGSPGTQVYNNTIWITNGNSTDTKGTNFENALINHWPRTWFGTKYGNDTNQGGTVLNNQLTGGFSYGIAITSAANFTVQGNRLTGNTSFIGGQGPNCSTTDTPGTTSALALQAEFQPMSDGESLTCVLPPNGGDFWPYGLTPSNVTAGAGAGAGGAGGAGELATGGAGRNAAGVGVGVVFGIAACAVGARSPALCVVLFAMRVYPQQSASHIPSLS